MEALCYSALKRNTWQNIVRLLPVTATYASFFICQATCQVHTFTSQLARESFPPCMHHLHKALRRDHHLRHFGQLQYGLFLKSIGLTLEQALTFWRTEFTKKMEPDKVCGSQLYLYLYPCLFLFCTRVSELFWVYFYWPMDFMYVMHLASDIVLLHTLVCLYCPCCIE